MIFFNHQNRSSSSTVEVEELKSIKFPALVQIVLLAYENSVLKCWDMFLTQHFSLKVATLTLLKWCHIITPLSSHSTANPNELICINVGFVCPSPAMPLWFKLHKTDKAITCCLLFHSPKQTNPPKDPHKSSPFLKHFTNIFSTS